MLIPKIPVFILTNQTCWILHKTYRRLIPILLGVCPQRTFPKCLTMQTHLQATIIEIVGNTQSSQGHFCEAHCICGGVVSVSIFVCLCTVQVIIEGRADCHLQFLEWEMVSTCVQWTEQRCMMIVPLLPWNVANIMKTLASWLPKYSATSTDLLLSYAIQLALWWKLSELLHLTENAHAKSMVEHMAPSPSIHSPKRDISHITGSICLKKW